MGGSKFLPGEFAKCLVLTDSQETGDVDQLDRSDERLLITSEEDASRCQKRMASSRRKQYRLGH
jgi:hypothetical protein